MLQKFQFLKLWLLSLSEAESAVSTKRRLSLSYLLDQNENLPQHTTANPLISEDCRLAPISTIQHASKPAYSAFGQGTFLEMSNVASVECVRIYLDVKLADNLPPIQHPFNSAKLLPYKQEDLPPIQKQLQYIGKR